MSRLARLISRLLSSQWCDECEQGKFGGPGGSWWHADGCSHTMPPAPPKDRC